MSTEEYPIKSRKKRGGARVVGSVGIQKETKDWYIIQARKTLKARDTKNAMHRGWTKGSKFNRKMGNGARLQGDEECLFIPTTLPWCQSFYRAVFCSHLFTDLSPLEYESFIKSPALFTFLIPCVWQYICVSFIWISINFKSLLH